jgi:hypothetical protein
LANQGASVVLRRELEAVRSCPVVRKAFGAPALLLSVRGLTVFVDGFTAITGLAFWHGNLHVLETATAAGEPTPGTGAIVKVDRYHTKTTVASGLTFPTALTVGPRRPPVRLGPWLRLPARSRADTAHRSARLTTVAATGAAATRRQLTAPQCFADHGDRRNCPPTSDPGRQIQTAATVADRLRSELAHRW